jgi:hypothetical protein
MAGASANARSVTRNPSTSPAYVYPHPFLIYSSNEKNNIFFWDVTPSDPSRATDVSEEHFPYIFTVERISSKNQ